MCSRAKWPYKLSKKQVKTKINVYYQTVVEINPPKRKQHLFQISILGKNCKTLKMQVSCKSIWKSKVWSEREKAMEQHNEKHIKTSVNFWIPGKAVSPQLLLVRTYYVSEHFRSKMIFKLLNVVIKMWEALRSESFKCAKALSTTI